METKICSKCKKEKSKDNFINKKGGEAKTCFLCREKDKARHEANKEICLARSRDWKERNREHTREYARDYAIEHKEERREYGVKYYVENREREIARAHEYFLKNKEKVRETWHNWYVKNAEYKKAYRKKKYFEDPEKERSNARARYAKNSEKFKKYSAYWSSLSAKYDVFYDRLTVEESPIRGENGELFVKCAKCGKYFNPSNREVQHRIQALNAENSGVERRLYCSKECKDACPIYNSKKDPAIKSMGFERDPVWARLVKQRAGNKCERCGGEKDLAAHHIIPIKAEPQKGSEIDNGVCLCKECHAKAHSERGCRTSDLRKLPLC